MKAINPQKLTGNWNVGYALDLHTISSTYVGDDSYGHPQFETTRTEIGELLHKAKNRGIKTALDPILTATVDFLESKSWEIDLIIPTPPSNSARKYQPVMELADKISVALDIPVCKDCVQKVKDTGQLKNIYDPEKRRQILEGAFTVNAKKVAGKGVLLLDDLYRSGGTLKEISKELIEHGAAKKVYVLTITKTRSNR